MNSKNDNENSTSSGTSNVYELLLIRLYALTSNYDDDDDDDDDDDKSVLICSYLEETIILINDNTNSDRLKVYISYLKTLCTYIVAVRYNNTIITITIIIMLH